MEHYYTQNPKGEYNEHEVFAVIMGKRIELITADGVFSKNRADYGTIALLSALFTRHKTIGTLLDLGCGYGIIGISAALIAGAKSTMCDINERAVMLAQKNAIKNNVTSDIKISDGLTKIEGRFDIIITNPPIRAGKKTFYPWIQNANEYLNENGELWVIVQKKQGAPSIKKLMEQTLGNCETVSKDRGFHVLVSHKK